MTKPLHILTSTATSDGPHLLVLGAIHGNEKCGTEAISRLWAEMQAGILSLKSGTLTCVPICNPDAYAQDKRFVDANLNRVIRHHENPTAIEHHRANQIIQLITKADILLDLHSYSSGAKPFLFHDKEDAPHAAFAEALDIPDWITGWNDAYAKQSQLNDGDTASYAHSLGKTAILVECGTHTDPAGGGVGYTTIRRALAHFGITEKPANLPQPRKPSAHRLHEIVSKAASGRLSRDWKHLDTVKAGEVIAFYDNGAQITAPADGVIVLPDPVAAIGHEWFYFAKAD